MNRLFEHFGNNQNGVYSLILYSKKELIFSSFYVFDCDKFIPISNTETPTKIEATEQTSEETTQYICPKLLKSINEEIDPAIKSFQSTPTSNNPAKSTDADVLCGVF